ALLGFSGAVSSSRQSGEPGKISRRQGEQGGKTTAIAECAKRQGSHEKRSQGRDTRVPRKAKDKQVSRIALQPMTPALLTADPLATSTRHVVELRDVVMRFGGKQVLDHVSLAVAPQERLVIIGQSGAGKTTILRLILGILKPNAGSVFFRQHEVS